MRLNTIATATCLAVALAFSAPFPGATTGKVPLKSAGALAFNPDGVLFIGDSFSSARRGIIF